MSDFVVVWGGKSALTDSLDRDYAACRGDGWELIYEPPSPLTTPWDDYSHLTAPDPNRHMNVSPVVRRIRARAGVSGVDWQGHYTGVIAQQGRHR